MNHNHNRHDDDDDDDDDDHFSGLDLTLARATRMLFNAMVLFS
jgi:hypothetical protein